MHEKDNIYQQ